jgi:hypothetical protein
MTLIETLLGTAVIGVVGIALAVVRSGLRIVEHVVEDEVKARLPHAAVATLEQAIEALPGELQADNRAEWEPELASLTGQPLRALWFARQCRRAALIEAREHKKRALAKASERQPVPARPTTPRRDRERTVEPTFDYRYNGVVDRLEGRRIYRSPEPKDTNGTDSGSSKAS